MHVRAILEKYNISLRKSWGQNFLIHEKVAERIVSACELQNDDLVLEIGPGLGILTRGLAKAAGWVIAVELDKRLCQFLAEGLSDYKNLDIICEDILKFEIGPYIEKKLHTKKLRVVGNLPYYITTPIIECLIDHRFYIESALVTVQSEMARRLCAGPGSKDYGAISCRVQFYARLKKYFIINSSAFYPQPEVDSTLLKIDFLPLPAYKIRSEDLLFRIIRAGFNQRRKTILNALLGNQQIKKIGRRKLEQILVGVNIAPSARAETLSLADFVRLSNEMDDDLFP